MKPVEIVYFSDVLCVWAYIAQARVDAVVEKFGADVRLDYRFCSVFGDTASKIPTVWKDRGAYAGFNKHLHEVAARFPHVSLHADLWLSARPASSTSPHLFMKAVQLWERGRGRSAAEGRDEIFEATLLGLRRAFFTDCRDVAAWDVQCDVARGCGADLSGVEARLRSGEAHAALAADYQEAERSKVEGSPSFILNAGRQKLYGNVGFRLIEANIREFMRTPGEEDASWC